MKYLSLNDSETVELFSTMMQKRNLVPILGAGFSQDARTKDAQVPSSEDFRQIMLEHIRNSIGDEVLFIKDKDFSEVAEFFMDSSIVQTSTVKKTLKKYFTQVTLDESRKIFLACPWPYVYTLNIDDAIERNSRYNIKIIPNKVISGSAKNLYCVYKVHGDATEEIIYDEPSKIIFSTGQYIRSLTKNMSMLNAIKTDMVEQNILFVGCSLEKEIDLLYALAEFDGVFPLGRHGIFVCREKPNRLQEIRLAKHGIDLIVVIDSYDLFYALLGKWGRDAEVRSGNIIDTYLCDDRFKILSANKDDNLSFLLKDPGALQYHNKEFTSFYDATRGLENSIPFYHTARDLENGIVTAIENSSLILLRGRRFSGKTLLVRSIARTCKSKRAYLFDSNTTVDCELIFELSKVKNGLFLFDSSVLSSETAVYLASQVEKMMGNQSAIVIAVNRTEPDVVGAIIKYVDDENDIEISPRISETECAEINRKLDLVGILRFDCNMTFINNTFKLLSEYKVTRSELIKSRETNEKDLELVLVVAVADKVYSSLASLLGVRINEIFLMCERLAPIIDLAETTSAELRSTNSKYKVICNSKIGVAFYLHNIAKERGYTWLADRIGSVVKKLIVSEKYSSIGHSMYMFDAINHLMSMASIDGENTGFQPVMLSLYRNLQPSLSDSADYWLQRAKAILNIERDEDQILEGIEFALKSYHEAQRDRTVDNAEFLIALLYGKLCSTTKFKNNSYVQTAVKWFSQAVSHYNRNINYVDAMLDSRRGNINWFRQLCKHLEGELSDINLLSLKDEVDYLIEFRHSWDARLKMKEHRIGQPTRRV